MFREEIIDEMEFRKGLPAGKGRLTAKQLANLVCPHKPSIFESRFSQFKKGKIYELHFDEFLQIAKILWPDNFAEHVKRWSYDFRNYENILCAFEFAITRRMFDLLDHLYNYVLEIKICSDAVYELKEISKIYHIASLFISRSITPNETRRLLRDFYPTCDITKAFKVILECNTYYNEFDFRGLSRSINEIKHYIKPINVPYIKYSYRVRMFELLSQLYLFVRNNPRRARKYAKLVINADIGPKFTADGYYIMGMSFLYDDRTKCISYIRDYADMIAADGREDLASNIRDRDLAFVSTVWGERSHTNDISEQAHFEGKWGDKQKAKELIEKAILEHGESAYKIYYKAIAYDDPKEFSRAFAMFLAEDNVFHARLVVEAMSKWPEMYNLYRVQLENFKIK